MPVKLLLWNSNGLNEEKIQVIKDTTKITKPNIIIITESHKGLDSFLKGWKILNTEKSSYHGVSVLLRNDIKPIALTIDKCNRYIKLKVQIENENFKLVALYAPANSSKRKFWNTKKIRNLLSNQDIIAGDFNLDFNCVTNPNRRDLSLKTTVEIQKVLEKYNDAAIVANDMSATYKNISRIDRVYFNPDKFNLEKYLVTGTTSDTEDHNMIICKLSHSKRTNPMWRFKQFLVVDEQDKEALEETLDNIYERSWVEAKAEIIAQLKKLEKKLIRKRKKHFFQAKELLKRYPGSKNATRWKLQLKTYHALRKKAERLWLRLNKVLARELPSAWLTSKLKKKAATRNIQKIRDSAGNLKDSDEEILECFAKYYEGIYSEKKICLNTLNEMLASWEKDNLDLSAIGKKISSEELDEAIKSSKAKKSPGIDGLSNLVYKKMPHKLRNLLLTEYNLFMSGKEIPEYWKRGVITLIPKKGDLEDTANYRPITLLNSDYKLFCKILASRLNGVITKIIPNTQIGFMPRRLIYDNVLCLDILLRKKFKLINLDFRKAYDSVAHTTIIRVLEHVGFPKQFITAVKNMIEGSTARLIINRKLSRIIRICCGVKQGDPLSPLLFTFVIELLARAPITKTNHIPTIMGVRIPLLMFADDTTLVAKTEEGIKIWCVTLEDFRKATGLAVHPDKTSTILVEEETQFSKENGLFRYLGFYFELLGLIEDYKEDNSKAIERLKKFKNTFATITEKVSVLKTYINSTLTFKGFITAREEKRVEDEKSNFLWETKSSKRVLVSRQRAKRPFNHGGLGLVKQEFRNKALKMRLAERLIFDTDMKIHQMLTHTYKCKSEDLWELVHEKKRDLKSKIINKIIECWRKESPNHQTTHSVKELQDWVVRKNHQDRIIITPRQKRFQRIRGVKVYSIFKNIKSVQHLKLRQFLWLYFQGGLPFPHGKPCKDCGDTLSHEHIFIRCDKSQKFWERADRFVNLIYNTFPRKTNVKVNCIWNEKTFWFLWSEDNPSCQLLRLIGSITMYAIWSSRTKFPQAVSDIAEMLLHDQLSIAKTIKDKDTRNNAIMKIHKKWRTKYLWRSDGINFVMRPQFRKYIEEGITSTHIQLLQRRREMYRNQKENSY